jgi:hypothetical protein
MHIILLVIVAAAVGAVMGFIMPLWMLTAMTAIGGVYAIVWYKDLKKNDASGDRGIVFAILALGGLISAIPAWIVKLVIHWNDILALFR